MSLLDELKAVLGPTLLGMDVTLYADWASFYAACPLSRRMLVQHNLNGTEQWVPDRDHALYQTLFFSDDAFGLVFTKDGQPVTGVVYRRLTPDTAEQTLRIGEPSANSGLRGLLWDLGIRKIRYKIHKSSHATKTYMDILEQQAPGVRVSRLQDGYVHHELTLHTRP